MLRTGSYGRLWLRAALASLLLAGGAAFAQAPPMQVFHAVSTSMEPTVVKGEAVLINAEYYRARAPSRGDVVMLIGARDKNEHLDRVIGLPGDRIQLRGGRLFINDQEVPKRRIEDYDYHFEAGLPGETLAQYVEALPTDVNGGTREHRIVSASGGMLNDPTGMLNDTKIFEVPADHYFVLGDNRDHSVDSRTDLGFVPAGAIVGRAISHAGLDIE